ncbi:MAG TPA: FkbM family methyltransferase [Stellaceae bacterium]|nr:FkbM family methyltransferase [Stellaceae bacterium]
MAQGNRFTRFVRLPIASKYAVTKAVIRNPRLLLGEARDADPVHKLCFTSPIDDPASLRPAPFVLVAANHGTMIVNRNDFCVSGPFGFGVGHQLLNTSSLNREEVSLARTILAERKKARGPGVVAIDCGANLGVHTVEWARQMTEWGTVIAIEAQERIFYSLCGNITINNCMNARAIWAAVGAQPGKMRIPTPDYNQPASFGSLELRRRKGAEYIGQDINYDHDHCADVDVISIDRLELKRVDFVKIDVEGMEIDVLTGARSTIKREKPAMIIEVIKSERSQIKSFLTEFGYRYYRFAENILALHEADPMVLGLSEGGGAVKIAAA